MMNLLIFAGLFALSAAKTYTERRDFVAENFELKNEPLTYDLPHKILLLRDVNGTIGKNTFSKLDLEELVIASDKVVEINDGAICENQNLTRLYFTNLQQKVTRKMLENCNKLNLVSFNNVSFEDDAISGLKNLETVIFKRLKLDSFKNEFLEGLDKIREISIKDSKFSKVEKGAFKSLSGLMQLKIEKSVLKIENSLLEGAENLKQIYIEDHAEIESEAFSNLKKLNSLILINGKLDTLNKNSLKNLKQLTVLNIFRSNLESIEPHSFDDLENVKEIHLPLNKLTNFDENLLKPLKKLETLSINDNKFSSIDNIINENLKTLDIGSIYMNHIEINLDAIKKNLPKLKKIIYKPDTINCKDQESLVEKLKTKGIKLTLPFDPNFDPGYLMVNPGFNDCYIKLYGKDF